MCQVAADQLLQLRRNQYIIFDFDADVKYADVQLEPSCTLINTVVFYTCCVIWTVSWHCIA